MKFSLMILVLTEFDEIFSDDSGATKPPAYPEDGDGNSSETS